ncbi:MAG: 4-(cytidine 5'-diphospho)-2-C-methyl-D-erythritol kinase [Lachnospiraceae bacterium]
MDEMYLKALGKINLGLDVLRRREDGYHEVCMIMQTVNLYDKLHLSRTEGPGIQVVTNLSYLPVNENNLVYQAAKLLMDEFSIKDGLKIDLFKYLPVAAGMAGGSSDAAAVLFGVNRMFHLGLSLEELKKRGVKIGADVPFCLMRGTALAEGIGEKLSPVAACPPCYILLAKPAINVSTKFVYENLHANEIPAEEHPNIGAILRAMEAQDLYKMAEHMGNVLERVTVPAYPVVARIKELMMQEGAIVSLMSGSGPTVFGLFDDKDTAQNAYQVIRRSRLAPQVFLTTAYNK